MGSGLRPKRPRQILEKKMKFMSAMGCQEVSEHLGFGERESEEYNVRHEAVDQEAMRWFKVL